MFILLRFCKLNSNNFLEHKFYETSSNYSGAAQGNVLWPFSFLVYSNDLPKFCDSQMILYAEDSAIICTEKNIQNLKENSRNKLCNSENWIKLHRLAFNHKKKAIVCFLTVAPTKLIGFVWPLIMDCLKVKLLSST